LATDYADRADVFYPCPSVPSVVSFFVPWIGGRHGEQEREKVTVNGIDILIGDGQWYCYISAESTGCGRAGKLQVEYPGAIDHLRNRGDRC